MDPANPPLVKDVMAHAAYPTTLWELEPHSEGKLPVAHGRGGPINIHWEIHGEGPIKLAFIGGLGTLKSSWQRQTLHFGHEHGDKYSVLLFDNRGMGDSDRPILRYSTSEMARDLIEVLDHVGWTSPRCLNLVGISMGGMIAQEVAVLIPERLSTLSLLCTAAKIENTTSFTENMVNRITMLLPKSLDRTIAYSGVKLFSQEWLPKTDDTHLPSASTPKCKLPEGGEYLRFDTNYQRFAAQELHKQFDPARFNKAGFIMQLIAAGWHQKSPEQLKDIADKVGRERILVLHGTSDGMISVPHGRKLIEYIKPGVGQIIEGMGHAPVLERTEWTNKLLADHIETGLKLNKK